MSISREFGRFLKQLRMDADLSLGAFSRLVEYDVSNLSKIERGLLVPPPSQLLLRRWLRELKVDESSPDYQKFIDLAVAIRSDVPDDLSQKELYEYLPAFYRTIRSKGSNDSNYDDLIKLLKRS